jgi:hypothetical protein
MQTRGDGAGQRGCTRSVGHRMQGTHSRTTRDIWCARAAQLSGDVIEMENCYQHAEHYFRAMRGQGHERRG